LLLGCGAKAPPPPPPLPTVPLQGLVLLEGKPLPGERHVGGGDDPPPGSPMPHGETTARADSA